MANVNVLLGAASRAGAWPNPDGSFSGYVRRGSSAANALAGLERAVWGNPAQRKFALHRLYYTRGNLPGSGAGTAFPNQDALDTAAAGRIPSTHWRIWNVGTIASPDPNAKNWKTIAAGNDDNLLRGLADAVSSWPNPKPPALTIDFDWEQYAYSQEKFNIDGHTRNNVEPVGTRQEFVAAFRQEVTVIKNRWAATTAPSFPVFFSSGYMIENFNQSSPKYGTWEEWWPGNDVSDFVGVDVYNWHPFRSSPWTTLTAAALPAYQKARSISKQCFIGETACQEGDGWDANLYGPGNGGYWSLSGNPTDTTAAATPTRKSEWIDDMRATFSLDRATGGTVNGEDTWAICWFDSCPGSADPSAGDADHALDTRTKSTASFAAMGLDPAFNGGTGTGGGGGGGGTTSSVTGVFWNTGFEAGTPAFLEGVNGDLTVTTGASRPGSSGAFGLHLNKVNGSTAYGDHTFDAARDILVGWVALHIPSPLPTSASRIFSILGNVEVIARLTTAGKIGLRWGTEAVVDSSNTLTAGSWVGVEFRIKYAAGTIDWRVNGVDQAQIVYGGSAPPALLESEPFENAAAADEATITTTNTTFDATQIGATSEMKFDTAHFHGGAFALRTTAQIGETAFAKWLLATAITQLYQRGYYYLTATPTDTVGIVRFLNSSATQAIRVVLDTARHISIRDASNAIIATSTTVVPLNAWFRIETRCKAGATTGEAEVRIFATSAEGAVGSPDETLLLTARNTSTDLKEIRFGVNAAPTVAANQYWSDDLAIASAGWIGPTGGGGGSAGVSTAIRFGSAISADVVVLDFDDVVLSEVGKDYPLGDHNVVGKKPNGLPDTGGREAGGGGSGGGSSIFTGLTDQTTENVGGAEMPQLDTTQANMSEGLPHTSDTGVVDTTPDIEYIRVAQTILEVGNVVYIGGGFHNIGGVVRQHLAAFDHTNPAGGILAWNPGATAHLNGSGPNMMRVGVGGVVRDMIATKDGKWIYVAGNFTTVGGQARKGIAKIGAFGTAQSGVVDATFIPPNFTGSPGPSIASIALSPDEATLYAGGDFTSPTSYLVALDAKTGARVGTAGATTPGVGSFAGTVDGRVEALALSPDGAHLYVCGKMGQLTAGGVSKNRDWLGSFTTVGTGTVDAWNPSGTVGTITWRSVLYALDLAVSPDGKYLVAGANGGGAAPANAMSVWRVHGYPTGAEDAFIATANSLDDTGNCQAVAISNSHAYGTTHASGERLFALKIPSTNTPVQVGAVASYRPGWTGLIRGGWAIHLSDTALNVGGSCSSPRMGYARYAALTPATPSTGTTAVHVYAVGDGADGSATSKGLVSGGMPGTSGMDGFCYLGDTYPDGTGGNTGDMVTHYHSVYGTASGARDLRTKTSAVAGNHEWHTTNAQGWRDYWQGRFTATQPWPGSATDITDTRSWYTFIVGGYKFIVLDTGPDAATIPSQATQQTFLQNELAADPSLKKIILTHKPRWSGGSNHGDQSQLDALWTAAVAGGAVYWIGGHEHNSQRHVLRRSNGNKAGAGAIPGDGTCTRQIVAGSGGGGGYGWQGTYKTPDGVDNALEWRNNQIAMVLLLDLYDDHIDARFLTSTGAIANQASPDPITASSWTDTVIGSSSTGTGLAHFVRDTGVELGGGEWARVDDWPPTGTDGIEQQVAAASDSITLDFEDVTEAGNANGLTVVAAYRSTATGANSASIKQVDPTQTTTIFSGSMGGAGVKYTSKGIMRPTGESWTKKIVGDSQAQFGFSSDVDPLPILESMLFEVALRSAASPGGGFFGTGVDPMQLGLTGKAGASLFGGSSDVAMTLALQGRVNVKVGKASRRIARGLGWIVHHIESDAGSLTIPALGDWQANEEAPGGQMDASGLLDPDLARRWPDIVQNGSILRSVLADTGEFVFGGRLLTPGVAQGGVLLSARGWGSVYGEKNAGNFLVEEFGVDNWTERDQLKGADGSRAYKNNGEFQLSTDKNRLVWNVNANKVASGDNPNDAGFIYDAGDSSVTRVKVTLQKSGGQGNQNGDTPDFDIMLEYANNVGGPRSTGGITGPGSGGSTRAALSGAHPDGSSLEWVLNSPAQVVIISVVRNAGAAVNGDLEVQLSDVHVNGIGTNDDVAASTAMEAFADTLGLTRRVIMRNDANIAPYSSDSGPVGDTLDWFSMFADAPWIIRENLGPFFEFQNWDATTWFVTEQAQIDPVQLDRYTGVRVPFKRNAGGRSAVVVDIDPNPLGYDATYSEVEIDQNLPDRSHAEDLGNKLLAFLFPPRYGGSGKLAEVRDPSGASFSAHHVRAGHTLVVPWLDVDTIGGPPTFRVEKLRRSAEGVEVQFAEQPTGVERLLRRRAQRLGIAGR